MKKISLLILISLPFFVFGQTISNQGLKKTLKPIVKRAAYSDVSKPLRDMKPIPGWYLFDTKTAKDEVPLYTLPFRDNPFGNEKNQNPHQQKYYSNSKASLIIGTNVDGVEANDGYGVVPPDPYGDVGKTYYVQMVNNGTQIFRKSDGSTVLGPFDSSQFWDGFDGSWTGTNDGDPVVMYDEQADRWVVTQFAWDTADDTNWELVAVSETNDPTGSYYRFAFEFADMPDYPKLGIFLDSYVLTVNSFSNTFEGTYVCALDRNEMLDGPDGQDNPAMISFFDDVNNPSIASEFSFTWMPADIEGPDLPAAGTDIPFVFDMADETYWSKDALVIATMHVDWNTPSNSTFTLDNEISITQDTDPGDDAPQPSNNAEGLDLLNDRMMSRAQFRHFDTYDAMVCTRTVDDGTGVAAIRWYELRNSGAGWDIYQQGTYAPGDGIWRWMPAIAMNGNGDIAIAYATSDAVSVEPSMRAVARYASDNLGEMTTTETVLYNGNTSQDANTYTRWGDYFSLMVDPSDDYSFWFTGEYSDGGWDWVTRITEFSLPASCTPPSNQATDIVFSDITDNSITASWTSGNGDAELVLVKESSAVDQDPTSGTIYSTDAVFGSGDELGTGNFAVYDGTTGTVIVTGLTSGVTYYFAVYTYNSVDNCYNTTELAGNATTVGPPSVTTDATTSITGSGATSGGNVTSDNGSTVTARGVCWNTLGTPTTADNTTSDGSGTGTFTSSITGLSALTTYYVRAYATNANGTSYGNEETFTTDCGIISTFPWTEDFENGGSIPNCWSQSYVGSSDVDWLFGAGNGSSNPNSAHGGSYNAYLKDSNSADDETDLITPTFDFTNYSDAQMSFWLYNEDWSGDQDELTIYYRTSTGGTWVQIGSVYNDNISTWTQYSVSLPNLSSDYSISFRGNALYGYGVCIDDVEISATSAAVAISWNGNSDSNWQNTGNWDGGVVPTLGDDVTIPAGMPNYPIINNGISTIAICNNLTIDNGASVIINPDGYLTVAGSITNNAGNTGLVINSDDTGTGSLIQNTSGGVDATVERKLPSSGRQWHMVASPIDAAPLSVFSSSNNLYYYDESTADYWTGADYDAGSSSGWTTASGNMGVAKGYVYNNFAETLTFTGQLNDNTSTSSISVIYTNNGVNAPNGNDYDDFDGWNFIGNPYTSAIDWDNAAVDHAGAHLLDAVYCYDDETAHTYTSYVGGVGTNGGTQYIPAMQGFFVKGDNTETSGTLNIGSGALVHSDQAFWKSTYKTPKDLIRLEVSSNNLKDETVVRLTDNATSDMDNGLDAYKMFTLEDDVPQIYTNSNSSTEYSINSLKTISEGTISIPLKVSQTDGTFTISISELTFSDMKVYLKDNLNSETVELGLGDVLDFTTDVSDAEDRFELIFEKSATNIIQADNVNVTLYPNPNNGKFYLTVGKDIENYEVSITNVTGQVVYKNLFNDGYTKELNLNSISNGIYFVKIVFSDKSLVNKKIIIE